MPFTKSALPIGKKQAPMPGPKSATYKRIVAARKSASSSDSKGAKKRSKTPVLSTLKSRQMLVDRIKREIWASVQEINQAIINLALAGNYSAAKALFDFAGVYTLPAPEEAPCAAPLPEASPVPSAAAAPTHHPVDAFFKSIGIEPAIDELQPALAASAFTAPL